MKKKKPFSELVIGLACIVLAVAVFIAAGNLQKLTRDGQMILSLSGDEDYLKI